jgi:hypothetical protein
MKITRSDGERLIIVDFPWVMAAGLTFFAVGFVIQEAIGYTHTHVINQDGGIGCGVSVLFLLCATYITKRSVFTFDLMHRQLEWSATSVFGRKGGIVPFHEIEGARIATMSDNRGRPSIAFCFPCPTATYRSRICTGAVPSKRTGRCAMPSIEPSADPRRNDAAKREGKISLNRLNTAKYSEVAAAALEFSFR